MLVLHEHEEEEEEEVEEEEEEPRRFEYRPRSKCSRFLAAFFSCAASKQRGASGVKQASKGRADGSTLRNPVEQCWLECVKRRRGRP